MFLGADTSRLVCAASGVDRAVGFFLQTRV
jgi:hypothetical protein